MFTHLNTYYCRLFQFHSTKLSVERTTTNTNIHTSECLSFRLLSVVSIMCTYTTDKNVSASVTPRLKALPTYTYTQTRILATHKSKFHRWYVGERNYVSQ